LKLTRMQDVPGALSAFEKAAALEPARPEATSLAAELLLESGRAADAVALYTRHLATVRERPAAVSLNLRLAELCAGPLKDSAAARAHWETVLKLEPQNSEAAYALAHEAVAAQNLPELEKYFEAALGPGRPVAQRLALCRSASGLLEAQGKLR